MKTFKFCCLVLIVLLPLGCQKKKNVSGEDINYIPGEVLIGLYDSTTFQETCSLIIYDLNLPIKSIDGFKYFAVVGEDSCEIIKSILNSKEYLTYQGRVPVYIVTDSIITIKLTFFNFGQEEANDWFEVVSEISLIEDLSEIGFFKWGVLKTPEGYEEFWINKLSEYEIIRWAELNYIYDWD